MTIGLVRLRSRFGNLAARTEGNPAIEFALIGPLLILLALGALDYGGAYVESARLKGAAHAGAELALYDTTNWQATDEFEETALEEYVGHSLTADQMAALPVSATSTTFCGCNDGQTIDCTVACPSGASANRFVRVTLSRDIGLMLPYPWVSTDTMNVVGEAVVRVH